MVCMRCHVSGRVQGVFYRESARRVADELGVTGYAVNLSDGRVEVLACGDERAVKAMVDWLWKGSRMASVEGVETERVEQAEIPGSFSTA